MIYLTLFWEYFKVGLFTIGGGYAMLPLVTQIVTAHGWLTEQQLIEFVGVAESTPGPFAINLATFVGSTVGSATSLGVWGGFLGSLTATIAVVLPSLIIIIAVTALFDKFQSSKVVRGALKGIRPVVVGLILSALFAIAAKVVLPQFSFKNIFAEGGSSKFNWVSLLLIVAFFALSQIKVKGKKIHPIWLILLSAAVGVVLFGAFGVQA